MASLPSGPLPWMAILLNLMKGRSPIQGKRIETKLLIIWIMFVLGGLFVGGCYECATCIMVNPALPCFIKRLNWTLASTKLFSHSAMILHINV